MAGFFKESYLNQHSSLIRRPERSACVGKLVVGV